MPGKRWTEAESMLLTSLWRKRTMATLIALELDRPYDGVLKQARRLGLRPKFARGSPNDEKILTVRVDPGLFYDLMKEARRRKIAVVTYIRQTLTADLSKSKPSGEVAESG